MFEGKKILLGIGGGIAAYRVAELVRLLKKSGMQVRCVMTKSACEFISPMTFEALSGHQVYTELFDLTAEREMGHIKLARWADAVIIAPATASLIAKLAHGVADDLLTTIMHVNESPLLLAPAMNSSMWHSIATQHNVETLKQRGAAIVGPDKGELACGEQGIGRLAEVCEIVSELLPILSEKPLSGQRWVINAGPTVEAWDDVRILTNRSSGMLGALLADLASIRGAEVAFIAGPGTPETHPDVKRSDVISAIEMLTACEAEAAGADVFIGSAAVSDFRFKQPINGKLKRGAAESMNVEMVANPDIIALIARSQNRPARVIAFAAESENHVEHAKAKLESKGVDAVIANDVSNMGSERGGGWWVSRDSEQVLSGGNKLEFAETIIEKIMEQDQ